jgi:hypothetical protein
MPQQATRLIVVFVLLGIALMVSWRLLIPETFGDLGRYRAAALEEVASRTKKYAGRQECAVCHSDIEALRVESNHRGVSCEVCHGPAADHAGAPMDTKPAISRERETCTLCHGFNPSRPTGFAQVDANTHNAPQACVTCHSPHAPEPPVTPEECGACHGQIARQKSVSHHATLSCSTCHVAQDEHKLSPREFRPTRPRDRPFCGGCHSEEALAGVGIPQVDLGSHGNSYLCWQCHYPHYPEIG